jgi:hypothetical protein
MDKEQFVIPEDTRLWEYIGDLSQDILECSYNEDDVRQMWVNGRIDQDVAEMLELYHWRLEGWRREDNRYSDLLTALVIRHGGWAPHYGTDVDPIKPVEQAIVTAFLDKYDIVVDS